VFACACDAPFVGAAAVAHVFGRLGDADVAIVEEAGRPCPLFAVYRPSVAARIERLMAQGRLRPIYLLDEVPSVRVDAEDLRAAGPGPALARQLQHGEATTRRSPRRGRRSASSSSTSRGSARAWRPPTSRAARWAKRWPTPRRAVRASCRRSSPIPRRAPSRRTSARVSAVGGS